MFALLCISFAFVVSGSLAENDQCPVGEKTEQVVFKPKPKVMSPWAFLQLKASQTKHDKYQLASAKSAPAGTLPFKVQSCTVNGCTKLDLFVTLDQNYRWYYHPKTYTNCFSSGLVCSTDGSGCEDCVLTGDISVSAYEGTYKVSMNGDNTAMTLGFPGGTRMYLLDASGKNYFNFNLLGKEMSFDVDVSQLPCGTNGALYFSEMAIDGGASSGEQGAQYGTGYCDAQCPTDALTVNGKANVNKLPQCCVEVDIWEANSAATANTPHSCQFLNGSDMVGPYACQGIECGQQGVCDKWGCDFNAYRMGVKGFYGPGLTVDTNKPFTVTTQFVTDSNKELIEMRRFYTQAGKVFAQPSITIGSSSFNSVSDTYCAAVMNATPGGIFLSRGGMASIGRSLARGQVLVMSVWNDPATHMLWLDGPTDTDVRGPCGTTDLSSNGNSQVTFSNVKFGDIGTTSSAATPSSGTASPSTTKATTKATATTVSKTTAPITPTAAATTKVTSPGLNGGFCCFSSSNAADACGTCYPTAIASADNYCAQSAQNCANCGSAARWCGASSSLSVTVTTTNKPKTTATTTRQPSTISSTTTARQVSGGFCCFAAASSSNFCGSCYSTAVAAAGSYCAQSAKSCVSCGGSAKWCAGSPRSLIEG